MNSSVRGACAAAGVALAGVARRDVSRPAAPLLAQSGGSSSMTGRIAGVDAARGIAMILVCLSHVRTHFVESAPALNDALTTITRLGTPSFLLLSGFVAAHVLGSGQKDARAALVDRALFLLLIGHVLIGLADLYTASVIEWLFGRVVVTDAIGVCLLVAVLLRGRSARTLFIIGISAMLLSWPVAILIAPESQVGRTAGAVLFHVRSVPTALVDAALVPYLGLFLAGMGLRKSTEREVQAGDPAALARRLFVIGGAAAGCALLGLAGWYFAKSLDITATLPQDLRALIRATLDPSVKLPPSPAYFLAYGGGALFIAAFCLFCRPRRVVQPLVEWTSVIGKASLLCFMLQDWLLRLIPALTGLDALTSPVFWLLYFVATLLVLHWAALRWRAARGNRFLTVGLRALWKRRAAA
jgi:uncharacterized membrane protein